MIRLYIGGIRGVGKTSACLELKRNYPHILYVSDSQLIMTALGLKTRDELWETPEEVKMEARRKAHAIFTSSENVIVDGHFVLFPEDVSKFDTLIWVDANNELVSRYWRDDSKRIRQMSNEEINEERNALKKQLESIGLNADSASIARITNDGSKAQFFSKIESLWLKLKER